MSPSVSDLKESKFLTKEDCDPAIIVTITGWDQVDVSLESGPAKMRYVLNFEETDKPFVLNSTNGNRIQLLTGKGDFDEWIGTKITLFNDKTVEFGGKIVGGIRVHVPQQPLPTAQQINNAAGQQLAEETDTIEDLRAKRDAEENLPF